MNSELNLYFVTFALYNLEKDQWTAHFAYVFASDENRAQNYIFKKYPDLLTVRSIEQLEYSEGTILK